MAAFTLSLDVVSTLRPARALTALAAALALSAPAWAVPRTFTGQGLVGPIAGPLPTSSAVFVADGNYIFTGLGGFDLISSFVFNMLSGTGTGGFEFSQGSNSFSGTIATSEAAVATGPGFEISYTITGGTGVYLGATGSGNGLIRLVADASAAPPFAYLEAGIMNVSVVPEPATGLLMLGGAAALFGRRWLKKA